MKRAAVVGYYGMRNVGDDAFTVALSNALPKYWGTTPILLAPRLRGHPNHIATLPATLFGKHTGIQHFARTATKLSVAAVLCDGVVYGGGSVFCEMGRYSEKAAYRQLGRVCNRTTAALGVSIGPFKSTADAMRLRPVIEALDFLYVRDRQSLNYLEGMRLRAEPVVGADLVSLLHDHPSVAETPNLEQQRSHIALGLLGWDPSLPQASLTSRNDTITRAVGDCALEHSRSVLVFVMNQHPYKGDVTVSERAVRLLMSRGVQTQYITAKDGPLSVMQALRQCVAGVHVRLHGGICSFVTHTPFVQVPYHEKCDSFLDEIGIPELNRVTRIPKQADITSRLDDLIASGQTTRVGAPQWSVSARSALLRAPWALRD